jgi:hypothetical protein
MRILWVILAVLLLSACQQPGQDAAGGTAGHATATSADPSPPGYRFFEAEFTTLKNEMLISLADACQARAGEIDLFDRCLRERVASAFDDSGEGRTHCAFHSAFGEFVDCVAMGNTFIDLRRRMTDTSPLPEGFWNGGKDMIRALSRSIVSKGVANCRSQTTDPTLNSCVDRWFEEHLELAPDLTRRCPPDTNESRTACLVEAVMIRYMQDHVPRLSAIGI